MASNPVFNQFDKNMSEGKYAQFDQPRYGQYATPQQLNDLYYSPSATSVQTGRMTLDDVITKTLGLFGIVLVTGAIGWFVSADNQRTGMTLWLAGMVGGLIVGLIIAFKKTVSVPLILAYAALEGLFLGACSQYFNTIWPGVVAQAVLATLCVFAGMFAGFKFGIIKVTDRSRKIFGMMIMGYLLFAIVNVILVWTGALSGWGVGGNGKLGILISIFAVALASYSLAVDFDSIQRGVRAGLPEKYSWLMAHGLVVSVVWLYVEMLRLFARLQQRN